MFWLADTSKDMIAKYLSDSDVYAIQKKQDEIICIAAILHISHKTLELKNIVTKEEYRGKGYAKILLKSLCGNYKQKYSKMIVGTTENNIPFYVKIGFNKYEKTIKNFFIDNYEEEIKDGELVCTDMIYYSKDLKKIKANYKIIIKKGVYNEYKDYTIYINSMYLGNTTNVIGFYSIFNKYKK